MGRKLNLQNASSTRMANALTGQAKRARIEARQGVEDLDTPLTKPGVWSPPKKSKNGDERSNPVISPLGRPRAGVDRMGHRVEFKKQMPLGKPEDR